MVNETIAVVLAGGYGSRLAPLTKDRAKPAVPFGGKYRIIDFTLTNCLHSGVRRILVLTQYKSHSLQKHLRDGWSIFNPELGEYVTTVPPQMRTGDNVYAGTADALYQNLYLLQRSGAKYVLVLSGDHIYRMDYAPMLKFHKEANADVTVACLDVDLQEAKAFGVVEADDTQRIRRFFEKPEQPAPSAPGGDTTLASMGIYCFSIDFLIDCLQRDAVDAASSHDFGKDIFPQLVEQEKRVFAYRFGGDQGRVLPDRYWQDVGTIDAYYQANMDMLEPVPPLNLYQQDWPIRTYSAQYPPARTAPGEMGNEGIFINSIVASGTVIAGGIVESSILFNRVYVDDEAQVRNAMLFDGVHVGKGAKVQNCIIDKDVKVPEGEEIGFDRERDSQRFTLSPKGIVVVPKEYDFGAG